MNSIPDKNSFQKSFVRHVTTTLARSIFNIDDFSAYQATALRYVQISSEWSAQHFLIGMKIYSVRDRLIKRWNETQQAHTLVDPKRIYYLSLEFLLGRSLDNALLNMGLKNTFGGNYRF